MLAFVVALAFTMSAGAAGTVWTNASGGDWSVATNWSAGVAPDGTSDVIFGNTGAGQNNTNDIPSETINSLTYSPDNGQVPVTVIPAGQTLTVSSSVAAGSPMVLVNSSSTATGAGTLVTAAVQGINSTLSLSGAGDILVAQCNSGSGAHIATLDLSGLGTLNATIGRIFVGTPVNSGNRPSGILKLAQTNNITLNGALPQVEVQEAAVNANGATASELSFGQVNHINANVWRLGGDKGNGFTDFGAAAQSNPSLTIRAADGASPVTVIDYGFNATVSTGNSTISSNDYSAGTVDILASLIHIPQGPLGTGSGASTGSLTLGNGTLNCADVEIAFANATAGSGATTGTLNLNNNGFGAGATLVSSSVINITRTNGGTATVSGTLNINNGIVMANAITSGGGVSTINFNQGTLTVTNTIGTLAHPIRNFFIGSAGQTVLNIPLSSSGAAITVSNLNTSLAVSNLINITSIPGIASYPATFTLFQYQGTENGAGPGTFTLNSLPQATPKFVGTIEDTGNGLIQVKLTQGPTAVLATTWTGAVDNNWDLTTANWLFQGSAADYVDGRATLFDDTATQTNVLLNGGLAPGSITVTNNSKAYTFGGTGNIAGSASLTKAGASSLTLDNTGGDNNILSVVISGGTLQIGANDTAGGLSAVTITNNGALAVNRTDSVTLNGAISGSGSLTQGGSGTLILTGANSYNGATSVTNGTLEIDQTTSGTGAVTASAGATLAGSGVVGGPVTVSGQFAPGAAALPGNFQANAGLTLNTGATASFGLSPADTSTSDNANDSVQVTGNLTVHNNSINVNFTGTPQGGQYTLFTYTGSLSGVFNPIVTGTHFQASLDTSSSPGSVLLNVNGGTGLNLKWDGSSSSSWDLTSTNWINQANNTLSDFLAGDSVLLDDSAGIQTTLTIPAGLIVYPSVITNDSDNNFFTINGSGSIGGSGGIVKQGASTLNIATANSFTGPVDIQAGILQLGSGTAVGNTSGVTVESNATLDVDGQSLNSATVTISGPGVNGNGAIINTGGAQAQVFRTLILAGDATLGGGGNMEMNNSGGAASLTTGGNAFNLTKVGGNVWDLQNVATIDSALANIDIQGGTLLFNGQTPGMGDPSFTTTVEVGASLAFGADTVTWNKNFVFNGDGTTQTVNNEGSANCVLNGPVTLNGPVVFNVGGTQLGISGNISGAGGIIKQGTSLFFLTGANSYTGDTVINGGTLQLTNSGTLTTSSNITIAAGATLDMSGTTLTLVSGQSLNGNGTVINSSLVANAGSTVSPGVGTGSTGNLSVHGAVTLSGTSLIELDPGNNTNDVIASTVSIALGGTLTVSDISGIPFADGQTFKILSAPGITGAFAGISPTTPGPGLTWDTSALKTTGTLAVKGSAAPRLTGISITGTTLHITAANGAAGSPVVLLQSTNIALPLNQWKPVLTNAFDGSGNLNLTTNVVNTALPQDFYILSQ